MIEILLAFGIVLSTYVAVCAIILFVRIAMVPRAEWIHLRRMRQSDSWKNSYMAVNIKTGKVR